MPIYGYRCSACGHQKDVLQKLSDPPLTHCPACGAEQFAKQVSAPAFQLKGTGWYVTDFRDGNQGQKAKGAEGGDAEPRAADAPAAGESGAGADKGGEAPAGKSGSGDAKAGSGDAKAGGGDAKAGDKNASVTPAPAVAAPSTSTTATPKGSNPAGSSAG